jgi:rSAM/selenodomain-associated transferase 2
LSISVIIPALNESASIAAAIVGVRRQHPREIIVVDGGSDDDTLSQAKIADVVLETPRGRAQQMNAGAARAIGDIIIFLHADCRLQVGALAAASSCLANPEVVAGCFSMHVPAEGRLYRWIETCAAARVRLTGFIYGDQGLFVRRTDFMRIGGFPSVTFLEDVLISRSLRRLGRMVVLPERIEVSARRWQRAGIVRQTLRNWMLTALAAAGVSPHRLARFYPAVR